MSATKQSSGLADRTSPRRIHSLRHHSVPRYLRPSRSCCHTIVSAKRCQGFRTKASKYLVPPVPPMLVPFSSPHRWSSKIWSESVWSLPAPPWRDDRKVGDRGPLSGMSTANEVANGQKRANGDQPSRRLGDAPVAGMPTANGVGEGLAGITIGGLAAMRFLPSQRPGKFGRNRNE